MSSEILCKLKYILQKDRRTPDTNAENSRPSNALVTLLVAAGILSLLAGVPILGIPLLVAGGIFFMNGIKSDGIPLECT